jgi:cysteine synthase
MRSLTQTELSEGRGEAPRALGPRTRRYAGIVESIGDTPTIEIPRLAPSPDVRLFAKLEAANPTGSIKDRVARALIEDLEARGRLKPGSIILEATSGNTGIALAMIGRRKGYRVAVVMPDNVTLERRQLVALHGAEVIDSPGASGSNGAIALARELVARDPQFVMADQYANPANPRVHEETTGPEILDAVPELDAFVAGLGTGGTLTGVGRFLRRAKPGVRIVAAEPLPGEAVQGLRSLDDGFVPEIFDPTLLDDRYVVANRDAVETARELLEREGVLAGPSSGAILWVAARVAETMAHGTIVALLPDGGWKYLSTGTYSRPLDEMEDELEGGVAWW